MKKLYLFTLALGLLLLTPYWSQAQFTTIDFNTDLENNQGLGKSYAREGFTFAVNLSVANERQIVARTGLGFEGSVTLYDNNVTIGDLTRWTITKNDGAEFQFRGIYLQQGDPLSSASGTIQGFKNGTPVGSAKAISFNGLKDYAGDEDFYDVDEIRIEAADINFYLDHFSYGPPFSVGDDDPAEVLNIALVGSPTSTETEVSYTVTFSKGAFNVDITDFELTTTGSVTANLASVTGANGSTTYTAVVNNIAGEGSLRLDLKEDTDIENEDGTDGTAAFTGGQVHYVGSCFTETFDQGETNGATTFSGNGKTFSLTGNWTVNTESPNNGLGGSAFNLKNNGTGPYTINLDDGVIAVLGLFLYLSSVTDGSNPTADGSVAIRGLRSGSEVYAFVKTTGFATNFDTHSGYTYIDFSAESGDHSAELIDQLEISIGGAFTYLNLDNFSWCLDFVPPFGYTVAIDQDPITLTNETSISFTFAGAEIGTTYDYTFTSDEGGTPVLGSGTIATETDQVTGIDLSGLNAGIVTLSVTLTDASGNVGAVVTDEVEKIDNNAPVATPPTAPSVMEDSEPVALADNMGVTDEDGDDQTLTFTIVGGILTLGTDGIVFGGDGNGSESFTASGTLADINVALTAATFTPLPDFFGTASIAFVAYDGYENSNEALVSFTVTGVNDAPQITIPVAQTTLEEVALVFSSGNGNLISLSDIDVGSGNMELTLSVDDAVMTLASTAGLTFTTGNGIEDGQISAIGSLSNLNAALDGLTLMPATDFFGTVTLEIVVNDLGNTGDGGDLSDAQSIQITVSNVNDAPTVLNPIPDQNATQDVAFSFEFAEDTFADVDGDVLSYTAQLAGGGALPGWLSFDPATRVFSGTPTNWDVGTVSVEVIADDGNGEHVSDVFDIVVANVNDAPTVVNPIPDQDATQDVAFSFEFAEDTFEDIDGDVLSYIAQLVGGGALPGWLSFDPATRVFSGTPTNWDVGTVSIELIAEDGNGGSASDFFDIVVANVNDIPVLTPSGGITSFVEVLGDEPVPVIIDGGITVEDIDNPTLASATVSITTGHQPTEDILAFTNDGSTMGEIVGIYDDDTGELTLTSAGAPAELAEWESALRAVTYSNTSKAPNTTDRTITFVVNDGEDNSNPVTKAVSVTDVNDPPTIDAPAPIEVVEDVATSLTGISFDDVDAGSADVEVTFSILEDNGTLLAGITAGVTVTITGSHMVTLEGTLAAINSYVANGELLFINTPGNLDDVPLNVIIDDGGNSGGAGDPQTASAVVTITVRSTVPRITRVYSPDPDGYYGLGDLITIHVEFDREVIATEVGDGIGLLLGTGVPDRFASYASGSGEETLVFHYTVQPGDEHVDLDYLNTGALELATGSTIVSVEAGVGADLTLPTPGAVGSLSGSNELVVDGIIPEAIAKDITLELDADGVATLAAGDVNDGSSDNLTPEGGLVFTISQTDFDCSDVGPVVVTLTVIDEAGNESTTTATVTVEDVTDPNVQTRSIIVALDVDGQATITPEMVNDGSDDACGIATLSLSETEFNSDDLGINTITLTATDHSGNENDATATVVVVAFEDDSFVYDGTAKSLSIAGELPSGVAVTYTGNGQTEVDTYTVTATVDGGDDFNDLVLTAELEITKASLIDIITFDDDSFVYDGTAKSITISGDLPDGAEVMYTGNGQTDVDVYTVTATIDGGNNYEDLVLTATLEITAASEISVTFPSGSFVYDGTQQSLAIVGALPDGVTVTYTNNGRVNVGVQTVTATIDGGNNYEDLVLTATLEITPAARTLDFPALSEKTYGDADFSAGGTASSGETVTYTSSDESVAEIVDGLIRITGAGSATITATVPENSNYSNRPTATRALVVHKATQAITFTEVGEVSRDAGSVQLDVLASSGLPISLEVSDEQVATLNGTTLNIHRLGTVHITATQAGDANFEAAPPVTITVRVVDPSSSFPVRVHQAVSPNGDGINDFLMIEGIRDYPENRVTILNRNGTIVWEASGYDNGTIAFRGIGTGQLRLSAGTYFYVVEVRNANGRWEHHKGYFVLRY